MCDKRKITEYKIKVKIKGQKKIYRQCNRKRLISLYNKEFIKIDIKNIALVV